MKKPLDRITEAYNFEMGDAFASKVRERIHWICENAKGEEILDVGCSQGITSILLGREGKNVLGIDLIEESIQYANDRLDDEETPTKKSVLFQNANFMNMDFEGKLYDAILFGEVLEHITDPSRFLQKATTMLKQEGNIVVTLPFGINDYFDHKKTYYLLDLLKLQTEELQIVTIKSFGKWTGAIFQKNLPIERRLKVNEELVEQLETEFYQVERALVTENVALNESIAILKEQNDTYMIQHKQILQLEDAYHEKMNNHLKEVAELKQRNQIQDDQLQTKENQYEEKNQEAMRLQTEVLKLNEELKKMKTNGSSNETVRELKRQLMVEKKEKLQVKEQLMDAYEKEERLLKSFNTMRTKFEGELSKVKAKLSIALKEKIHTKEQLVEAHTKEERLLRTYNNLLRKYKALSESKLGKLTLSYWRKKSGKQNRAKRG